jgi:antitoxin component of MazEF toxin-antitoxin module
VVISNELSRVPEPRLSLLIAPTIPPEIQQQLGLEPGTEVSLEVVGRTLHLTKKTDSDRSAEPIKQAFGFLANRVDPLQFQAQVRNEWQR